MASSNVRFSTTTSSLLAKSRVGIVGAIVVTLLNISPMIVEGAKKPRALGQKAQQQIQALLAEKSWRTLTQRKIGSRLLHARKKHLGRAMAKNLTSLRTRVPIQSDGTTEVDIEAEVSESLIAQIEAAGGTIVNQSARYHTLRAKLPIRELETVATLPAVHFIRSADRMINNSHDPVAVNVSQGDIAHRADLARATFGVDGTGLTIGVLSNGVDTLAARQASGDLPANITILPGQAGSGDEGTAILEIVHDIAPGASLLYATAFGSQATFATNIEALRTTGADIIVDDVFYFAEHVFQDGIIAQAVNTVTNDGALYFSSAGNSGNLNDGTSGVWEGDFVQTAAPSVLGPGVTAHSFNGSNVDTITKDPPVLITLQWSDPAGGSNNDYDLFLLSNDLNTVFDFSSNIQNGTQDPIEFIDSTSFDDTNNQLVIVQHGGAANRFLHLNTHRGQLAIATDGQISGHAAAEESFGVAAVNVATAGGANFVGGGANPVETFSSDGPRQIFYNPDSTPITPGNVSSTGGIIRQKPDIAAADGVATSTPGFNPFFGTSAAAPHAAAIAALVLQADPSLTPTDVRNALQTTTLDIESIGYDRDSGHGLLDALSAVQSVAIPSTFPVTVTLTGTGNGTVTSNPGGIDCPSDCTEEYPENTVVTLTAKANTGSTFTSWSGAGCSGTRSCIVTVDQAHSVTATFTLMADQIPPVVTPPSNIVVPAIDATGTSANDAAIQAFLHSATATDNIDGDITGGITQNAPVQFALGSTTVTFSVTDSSGNTGTAQATVTVTDQTPPVVTPPTSISLTSSDGQPIPATDPAILGFLGSATALDNVDGGLQVTNNVPPQFPLGATLVTFTATDSASNNGNASATITILPPPGNDFRTQVIELTIPSGEASVTVTAPISFEEVNPQHTITLISGITQHAMGWIAQSTQDPGEISAQVSLVDGSTLTATRSQIINQSDTVWVLLIEYTGIANGPNEFLVRDRRTHDWASSQSSTSYGPLMTINNGNKVVVFGAGVENPNTNSSQYDRGDVRAWVDATNTVQLVRGDGNGAISSIHQVVEFVGANWMVQTGDTVPSQDPGGTDVGITSVSDISTAWVYFTWSTNSANLDERGHRVWLTSPTTLRVQEDANATSTKTLRWYVIQNPDMHVQTNALDNQFTFDLTATISGFTPVYDLDRSFAWVTGLTDGGGNAHSRDMWQFRLTDPSSISLQRGYSGQELSYQYMVVELPNGPTGPDLTPPVVTPLNNITVAAVDATGTPASEATIQAFLNGTTATDNIDGDVTSGITHNAPPQFALGSTTVTFSVTDNAGNTGTAQAIVTVIDQTPPVVTPPTSITLTSPDGQPLPATDPAILSFLTSATALDNVDGGLSVTNNAPLQFPLGATLVTFTATDSASNNGNASATITILPSPGNNFRTQVVELTIPSGEASVTVTAPIFFEEVNPQHTITLISGVTQHAMGWTAQSNQDPREISARVSLVDGSTITATRSQAMNQTNTVWVLLVEYTGPANGPNEWIVRNRRTHNWSSGQSSTSYGPLTTIANANKVVVFGAGTENPNTQSNQYDRGDVRAWLDATHNVQLVRGDGNGAISSTHQVVEFVGANWVIQTDDTIPSPDPGGTDVSINSVSDISTAWVYFTWSTSAANLDERGHRVWLTSPTNLRVQEDAKATGNKTIRWFVIQNPALQVQTGVAENQFNNSLTATISGFVPVTDLRQSFAWVTGLTDGTGNAHSRDMWQFELADQSTINLQRGYSGQELSYRYFVVELP